MWSLILFLNMTWVFFCSHTILFVEHLGNNNNNKSVLIVSCLVRVCRSGYACFTLMLWPLVLPNGDLSGEGGFTVLPVGNGFKTMVAGKGKVEKSVFYFVMVRCEKL